MFADKLTKLLGIEHPIIQGGMAWVSDASLAAAVSEAGGLGVLAAGNAPTEWVKDEIIKIQKATKKPFAVNVMLLSPYAEELADLLIKMNVKVVITGAGDPSKYLKKWQENGIKVLPVVASSALAKRMQRSGCDAVIAEGGEAGGHIGKINTMTLIPVVRDAVSIPVVAAGGIADGRGILAAKALGADGVQIGTRFIIAKECTVHPNYKAKILKAKDIDTVATGQHTGHPVRVIKNKLARTLEKLPQNEAGLTEFEEKSKGALYRAAVEGDMETGSIMAGQCAALVKEEMTVKEIIADLINDYTNVLNKVLKND